MKSILNKKEDAVLLKKLDPKQIAKKWKKTFAIDVGKKFKNLQVVYNPEFLTERSANLDFINTSRIILGGAQGDVDALGLKIQAEDRVGNDQGDQRAEQCVLDFVSRH